ncbi:MAG: 3-methyl-2-oxobutanoate dehydrogenase subunit VorB [Bacillota bacterium]
MRGNEAFGEGALRAGCRYTFAYPITPQSEIVHFLARRLPEAGGVFLQVESEVAAVNMVFGAAAAGARVVTSSSSPGMSLMQEGLSYLAGARLPCVIVNVMRGGPGLGNIAPAQGDYLQAVKGGGHGDYRLIVLAPSSVPEIIELMELAFELADTYRSPVLVLGDGVLGQMMEPVTVPEGDSPSEGDSPLGAQRGQSPLVSPLVSPSKPWAVTGQGDRPERNIISSLHIVPEDNERFNRELEQVQMEIRRREQRVEEYRVDDAELVLVAFGTVARVAKAVVDRARAGGLRVGLIRPITLWPFPDETVSRAAARTESFLVVEMNLGQMVEDVRLAVNGQKPVHFYGRPGGTVPTVREVWNEVRRIREVSGGEEDLRTAAGPNG